MEFSKFAEVKGVVSGMCGLPGGHGDDFGCIGKVSKFGKM